MANLITNEQAGRIVALNKRLGDLRNNLFKLDRSPTVDVTAEIRFSYAGASSSLYTKNKQVVGIVRREHELAIAECIRELNQLGAEVKP